jgi:hypothetical protein
MVVQVVMVVCLMLVAVAGYGVFRHNLYIICPTLQ